jgi:integrase
LQAKKARLEDAKLAARHIKTFREVSEEWLDHKAKLWKPGVKGRPGTLEQMKPRFAKHIYPVIGDVPIHRFDMRPKGNSATDLVDGVLDPLWKANKIVTAKNIQEMINGVLALAIARNYGDLAGSDNAASVEEGQPLALLRPKISEFYTKTSHAAFPWQDIGRLVAALREYTWSHGVRWASDNSEPRKKYICQVCAHPERAAIERAYCSGVSDRKVAARFGVSRTSVRSHQQRHMVTREVKEIRPISAYVMEFIILTAVRKGQANAIRWAEIDMENRVWHCEEHKTREKRINRFGETVMIGSAHVVPLSTAAMAVLHAMRELQNAQGVDSEYAFPSQKKRYTRKGGRDHCIVGHVEHTTVNAWLRHSFKKNRPEFAHFTPHGMRTAFKSWARSEGIPEIDSEIALGHEVGTPVSRIYARNSDTIERGRPMMQKWADHCGRVGPAPDVVVPFRPVSAKAK